MQFSRRLAAGGSLLLLFSGCKWDLPDTNLAVAQDSSFTLTRAMSTDSFSGSDDSGATYNPTSCLSIPAGWEFEVEADITTDLEVQPTLALTEQDAAALSLENSFPRDGFSWACYSAYPTATALGNNSQGTVTYTITPDEISAKVQIASSLGLQVGDAIATMTLHDVFPGAVAAGEPVRLEDAEPLTQTSPFFIGGPILKGDTSRAVLNDKLVVTNLAGNTTVTFSFDEGSVSHSTDFPLFADVVGPLVVNGDELLLPVVSEGGIVIASSSDGEVWSPTGTGVAASVDAEIVSLTLDQANDRWELILRDSGLLDAYFLSNSNDENRLTLSGSELGMASSVSGTMVGTIITADGTVSVLTVESDVLSLSDVGGTDWIESTLLEGSDIPDQIVSLVKDGVLYVAMGGDYADSGFYQRTLAANTSLQLVSALPENDGVTALLDTAAGLVLVTNEDVLLSTNSGATWQSLLSDTFEAALAQGWTMIESELNALTPAQVLVSAEIAITGEELPAISAMLKVDIADGALTVMGGSATSTMTGTSPGTMDNDWRYLGSVGGDYYRYAANMNNELEIERFALKTSASVSSGGNTSSAGGGGSSGGGSLSITLAAMLMLLGLFRSQSKH